MNKIYFSCIRPDLEYNDIVWDNYSDSEVKVLEDIQVTAAGLKTNSSRSALYDDFGIDLLSNRRKVH